jgi:hypothetical protein
LPAANDLVATQVFPGQRARLERSRGGDTFDGLPATCPATDELLNAY